MSADVNSTFTGFLRKDHWDPFYRIDRPTTHSDLTIRTNGYKYIHTGKNNQDNFAVHLSGTDTMNDVELNNMMLMEYDGNDEDKSYPSHNLMPVVIYVGPSKYSHLSVYVHDIE